MECPDALIRSLYETQYEKMFKVAYRMIGSPEAAQDLVQEAFLLALFHQDELLKHPLPEGWLMLTLKNLVLNERRRITNHSVVSLDAILDIPGEESALSLESLLPKELSNKDKEILIWRFEKQMEYREIADRLGLSEPGCRSRVSRAVASCKQFMKRLF